MTGALNLSQGRIDTICHALGDVVDCPTCNTPRRMVIKSIHPALVGQDTITYRCTKCGTEETDTLK
ncbi:hypothetical protein [Bradyrhizobium prioriisuperbiae]|uniref:hypothetical protein n=1 Tax=Bradyrhizobium prioriisuperbiae TaxID=2854389 RepID=UPI0028E36704|nr:hypothetical protein [Bradyrhizobium prioritasuperba]